MVCLSRRVNNRAYELISSLYSLANKLDYTFTAIQGHTVKDVVAIHCYVGTCYVGPCWQLAISPLIFIK